MKNNIQAENLLQAWISLCGIIKNSRITKGLLYNEAIVMNILYNEYSKNAEGAVSIKFITQKTKMLKSLVNRTVNSLEKKGFIERCVLPGDKRMGYVRCVREKTGNYLKVHSESLNHAQNIIDIIGEEDAETFIRLVKKIENAEYTV